ncbi:hypothetical protein [Flavobacterium sp.]|uniref:hypothetical protein n=1 Tax=Flavobacterium sp. TaxID=239 RepID=UPI002B4B9224|nr:hypothetical protein [Flavobacterium sp.]HLP65194.1 hypothetical protein [Flavobacterium sp.]
METIRKINLINGEFTPIEASELLIDLYNKNINFNKIQNFSSQVRFGVDDENALSRIQELKESVEQIKEIVTEAKASQRNVFIKSFLEIELEE